jgi:hypothetical protein
MSSARLATARTPNSTLTFRQTAQPARIGAAPGTRHTPFPERLAVRRLTSGGGPRSR